MAVLVEAISVIVKRESIKKKFPGGWEAFVKDVPNSTLCADSEIARVGFMTTKDAEAFARYLETRHLNYLKGGKAIDIAIVNQIGGLTTDCDWLEFGHIDLNELGARVAACRHTNGGLMRIIAPDGWKFEGSLSQTQGYVSVEEMSKRLKFLRRKDGVDIYMDVLTGKEVYVGRTER